VHLERLVDLCAVKWEHDDKLMVRIGVKNLREGDWDNVVHDPTPGDPSHSLIVRKRQESYGNKKRKRRIKSMAKLMKF